MKISMKWDCVFGTENAIVSKSDAHRALIASALSDKPTDFNLSSVSKDIEATMNCLSALGAKTEHTGNTLTIQPISKKAISPSLNCNESGSTLRFLIPVAIAVSERPVFSGKSRLFERPLTPLVSAMEKQGCSFSESANPLTVSGQLKAGEFQIAGDISSQFISGLLFSLPLLNGDSSIILTSPLQSSAYVEMTIDTLKRFNIHIEKTNQGFYVPGNQKYISPGTYEVEGDWSNVAPFMAAAALNGEIAVLGLNPKSKQSDNAILSIIKNFGAKVENNFVKKSEMKPLSIDVSQFPDLFPVIAVLLCGANGKSVLYNAKRLRIKESDRIESTLSLIKSLGGEAEATEDSLIIYGTGSLVGGICDSFNDHRIVMAAAVASAISKESVTVTNAEAINKSFPDFMKHFEKTGGTYRVI